MRGMSKLDISDDATIADVVERLNAPEEYVRKVLANMYECRRQFGEPIVRIGLLGEGRARNYSIEAAQEAGNWRDRGKLFGAYSGLSHKKRDDLGEIDLNAWLLGQASEEPEPDSHLHYDNWSSGSFSLEEVSAVLGKLRRKTGANRR